LHAGEIRDDRRYAKSHEWAKVEGDVAIVGISEFAVSELGEVIYVETPEVGKEMKKADAFGVVESVKAASDVYCPVSGTVTEVNGSLVDAPGKV
jgi:glycine cleavage system H protein